MGRVRYVRYGGDGGFGVSPILVIVIINLLVFIAVQIAIRIAQPFALTLVVALGLPPPTYFLGQPWSIVTSMFLHVEFWHILPNMITLFFFGTYFSRLVGGRRFLLVYFGGGILGNIFLLLLASFFPYNLALGASGAVFALAGALVVMRPKLPVMIFPIPLPIPLWGAVIGGFVILSFMPSVAWQAHLGGLVFGLIAGFIFRRRERYRFF